MAESSSALDRFLTIFRNVVEKTKAELWRFSQWTFEKLRALRPVDWFCIVFVGLVVVTFLNSVEQMLSIFWQSPSTNYARNPAWYVKWQTMILYLGYYQPVLVAVAVLLIARWYWKWYPAVAWLAMIGAAMLIVGNLTSTWMIFGMIQRGTYPGPTVLQWARIGLLTVGQLFIIAAVFAKRPRNEEGC